MEYSEAHLTWPVVESPVIPVGSPYFPESTERSLIGAFRRKQVSGASSEIAEVETMLAELWGAHSSLLVANGSVALILALRAIGLPKNAEVLVPDFCYSAVASSVIHAGGKPVFCEIDSDWNLSLESARKMVSPDVAAIVTVDNYGVARDWAQVHSWARLNGLAVIHDSAEGHGGKSSGLSLGHSADIVTTSFFANKILTSGEGGALIFPKKGDLFSIAKTLRGQGMSERHRYWFEEAGFNFRLSNLNASLLPPQINRFESLLARRREIFERYDHHLSAVTVRFHDTKHLLHSPWLYSCLLPDTDVRALARHLMGIGIESRPGFYPLSKMPAYVGNRHDQTSLAEKISRSMISLPTYIELTDDQVDTVSSAVVNFVS